MPVKTIHILKIYKDDKKKDGSPLTDKNGRKQWLVSLYDASRPDERISGYFYEHSPVLSWDRGETHEIDEYRSKTGYLNFQLPKQNEAGTSRPAASAREQSLRPSDEGRQLAILLDLQKKVKALYDAQFPNLDETPL